MVWSHRGGGARVGQPDWSPDGLKLAYRSGDTLRVTGLDGGADQRVARRLGFAAPRWKPGKGYALAWADRRGRVRLLDATTGRTLWTSPPGPPVRPGGLRWSRTGTTLAAVSGTQVRTFDGNDGGLLRRLRARGSDHFQTGTFPPTGSSRLTLIRHDFANGGSRVTSVAARRRGAGERTLFSGSGRVVDATFSPDGRRLLVGWRGGDQWRFLALRDATRLGVTRRVTRRFSPGPVGRWAFPSVRGWCCPPR